MTTDTLPPILTVKQVAELMGWHPNTVYQRCTSIRRLEAGEVLQH